MDAKHLKGVVPPLLTPLTADGDLDAGSFRALLDYVIDAGCGGVFVLGSSGEGVSFGRRFRSELISVAVEHVAGRVPVLAGALAPGTGVCVEMARDASGLGVDAVVATPSFYSGPHPTEVGTHLQRIAEAATPARLFGYHIPSRIGGIGMPVDVVAELARKGVLQGMKDSGGDLWWFRQLRAAAPLETGFRLLTGSEVLVDVALELGADGVVPGLGNVDPAGFVSLVNAFWRGDSATVAREQTRLAQLLELIRIPAQTARGGDAAVLGSFKSALHSLGVIDNPRVAEPGNQLSAEEHARVRDYIKRYGLVRTREGWER